MANIAINGGTILGMNAPCRFDSLVNVLMLCRDEIFPRMLKFKPDIIFISAGFDAHKKDTINAGYIALVSCCCCVSHFVSIF